VAAGSFSRPEGEILGKPAKILIVVLLVLLLAATFSLRVWRLNTIPPGLFLDEAAYGQDVKEVLHGKLYIFFPRVLGHEPLFNYLAAPFVALWNGTPFAIRLVSALMGALMIPALFLAGMALWPERPYTGAWAGLTAAALWAANYWPQSVNRIAFHVNTMPLVVTLAIVAWLSWSHRPTRRRALLFGFLAGLTLATYLAARIMPLLCLLLYLALPARRRRDLRPTLGWALAAYLLAVAPLAVHFLLHPADFMVRVGTFGVVQQAGAPAALLRSLLDSAVEVAGVFLGGVGDPNPRHNLPGRAPFPAFLVALLVAGLLWALWRLLRREQPAWTLLLWLGVLSLPAIVAADANPHFLRLLGSLPAALLLAAWPVAHLAGWLRRKDRHFATALAVALALLVGLEGARTGRDYFVTWAKETDLYSWYSQDIWLLGERVAATPHAIGVVPVNPNNPPDYREFTLDYAFPDTPIIQMQVHEAGVEDWLTTHLGQAVGSRVLLPLWHEGWHVAADPKDILPFYLAREATLEIRQAYRGFDLFTFSLDRTPQFQAPGQRESPNQSFSSAVTLAGAQWGVGAPNPDSSGTVAAAGTPFWAILTWRLERPSPDLKVALDLLDGDGHRLASAEVDLLNDQRLPVSQWAVGTESRTYHLVDVPATQLPAELLLESRVYDARTLAPLLAQSGTPRGSTPIAAPSVAPPLHPQPAGALSLAHPLQTTFPLGVTLLGLDAWAAEIAPGQQLALRLFWQAQSPLPITQTVAVSLGNTGVSTLLSLPSDLPVGSAFHTYVDLDLPAGMAAGTYDLLLASQDGSPSLVLGQVVVAGRPHLFQAPPPRLPLSATFGDAVALLGADLEEDLQAAPGQAVTFGLVWQALGTPNLDLVRFVHLLGADGRPLAQQDSVPCRATCPALSWLRDEILVDEAELLLPADLAAGSYRLAIGWYDASTPWKRLSAVDAEGQPLQDDLFLLPVTVVVAPGVPAAAVIPARAEAAQ